MANFQCRSRISSPLRSLSGCRISTVRDTDRTASLRITVARHSMPRHPLSGLVRHCRDQHSDTARFFGMSILRGTRPAYAPEGLGMNRGSRANEKCPSGVEHTIEMRKMEGTGADCRRNHRRMDLLPGFLSSLSCALPLPRLIHPSTMDQALPAIISDDEISPNRHRCCHWAVLQNNEAPHRRDAFPP